jgi:hypothetical protein
MEAEVRSILEDVVAPSPDFIGGWVTATESLRGEFAIPQREAARPVELA